MSGPDIFVSVAYALYVAAPAIRDELWLRIALFVNSIGFIIWGLWIHTSPVVIANALFAIVSLRQIYRVAQGRKEVVLEADAERVHRQLFERMGRKEFAEFWNIGADAHDPGVITTLGHPVTELWVLLRGSAQITLPSGEHITRPAPTVIGEVTVLLDTSAASATVTVESGHLRRWSRAELNELFEADANVEAQMLRGLSKALANRLLERETIVNLVVDEPPAEPLPSRVRSGRVQRARFF